VTSVVTEHEKTKKPELPKCSLSFARYYAVHVDPDADHALLPSACVFFSLLAARACLCRLLLSLCFSFFLSLSFALSHSRSLALSLARAISLCTRARARTCACALLVGGGLEQVMLMDQHMVDISTFPLWVRVLCLNLVSSARTLHCAIVSSGKGPAAE